MGMYQMQKIKEITPQSDRHPDRELVAIKGGTGEPWTKKFYSNNKDLLRQLSEFGKGDWMELSFSGKYQNLDSAVAGHEPEKYEPKGGGGRAKSTPTARGGNVRRSDGTSRGDDTNRSASIYLAQSIIADALDEEEKQAAGPAGLLQSCTALANGIFNYITKGEMFIAGTDFSDDDLDPPQD